jgi:hypothetical protein
MRVAAVSVGVERSVCSAFAGETSASTSPLSR